MGQLQAQRLAVRGLLCALLCSCLTIGESSGKIQTFSVFRIFYN